MQHIRMLNGLDRSTTHSSTRFALGIIPIKTRIHILKFRLWKQAQSHTTTRDILNIAYERNTKTSLAEEIKSIQRKYQLELHTDMKEIEKSIEKYHYDRDWENITRHPKCFLIKHIFALRDKNPKYIPLSLFKELDRTTQKNRTRFLQFLL